MNECEKLFREWQKVAKELYRSIEVYEEPFRCRTAKCKILKAKYDVLVAKMFARGCRYEDIRKHG